MIPDKDMAIIRAEQELAEAASLIRSAAVKLQRDKRTKHIKTAGAETALIAIESEIHEARGFSPRGAR